MASIESRDSAAGDRSIRRSTAVSTTAKRLPEFRREVEQLEAQLERLRAVLPEERDVADLLRRVQAMATQSRLTIRGFTPRAVTPSARCTPSGRSGCSSKAPITT